MHISPFSRTSSLPATVDRSIFSTLTPSVPKRRENQLQSILSPATSLMKMTPVNIASALQEARTESRRQRQPRFSVYEEPDISTEGMHISPSTTPTRTSTTSLSPNQKSGELQRDW
jgi:hypothetical protein